jgi:3-methylcrotonyl-CoA carboxylase beta subunit
MAVEKRHHMWLRIIMPKIKSIISPASDEFKANAAAMRAVVADLAAKRAQAAAGGPEKLRQRHTARGKLLPRDRVLRLIDRPPFLELSQLAASGSTRAISMAPGSSPA